MRSCKVCGKGSILVGRRVLLRGHYNPTSTSRKYPNLQVTKVEGKRTLACVSCIKTIANKKTKPVLKTRAMAGKKA